MKNTMVIFGAACIVVQATAQTSNSSTASLSQTTCQGCITFQAKADARQLLANVKFVGDRIWVENISFKIEDVGKLISIAEIPMTEKSVRQYGVIRDAGSDGSAYLQDTSTVHYEGRASIAFGNDDFQNIEQALSRMPSVGTFFISAAENNIGVSRSIELPKTKRIIFRGAGKALTKIISLRPMRALVRAAVPKGGISVTIKELTLNGNAVADTVLALDNAERSSIEEIDVLNAAPDIGSRITANISLGNNDDHLIENRMSNIDARNDFRLYTPITLPTFSLYVMRRTSDNSFSNLYLSNAREAVVYDSSQGANFYSHVHAYGFPAPGFFPKYSFRSAGNTIFTSCESDGSTTAGFRSEGDYNSFSGGLFSWPKIKRSNAVGVSILSNVNSNIFTSNLFIKIPSGILHDGGGAADKANVFSNNSVSSSMHEGSGAEK